VHHVSNSNYRQGIALFLTTISLVSLPNLVWRMRSACR
jgi:hypothetical protein